MALFKKGFFDFRNARQRQADYEAYQAYMFPLGEAQREWIAGLLSGVPKKNGPEKGLFGFYMCKERYIEGKQAGLEDDRCWKDAFRHLSRQRSLVGKANIPYIFAAVMLDFSATSEEDYPTIAQVQALQKRLFAGADKQPNLDARPRAKTADIMTGERQNGQPTEKA